MLTLAFPFRCVGQIKGDGTIIQGKITSSADKLALIGVNISEIDANNRVVSGTVTDINGHYILRVKNMQNRLAVSYIGFVKQLIKINNKKEINFILDDNTQSLNSVEVTALKKHGEGGYVIPKREIGTAMQTISTKEFEGLQVSSVDEALQ